MREFLPKGYLEKFKDAAITQIGDFFDAELTEESLDYYTELLDHKYAPSEIDIIKKDLKKVTDLFKWFQWRETTLKCQSVALGDSVNKLNEFIANNKSVSIDEIREMEYVNDIENVRSNLKEDNFLRNLLEFTWDMNDNGNRIFKIEEQLTHELHRTDIKHIDQSFFKLPYQCCGFYLPFNNKITIKNKLVTYVYIAEYEENEGRLLKLLIVRDDEAAVAFNWVLKDGDILTQIKTQVTEKYETKKIYKDLEDILKFIISSVLYINSTDVDRQIISAVPKSPLNKGKITDYPVCSLGKGLTINKDIRYIKFESEEQGAQHEMHVTKWSVRGHFRQQQYGSGLLGKYKKVIWIRPFLKGKERGTENIPVKPNFYRVKPISAQNDERSVATST
jgi:hypothetical protein